jgi:hypothetical protein
MLAATSSFFVFFCLSGAVRDDDADEAVQSYEVSHLSGPILVNVNGPADALAERSTK